MTVTEKYHGIKRNYECLNCLKIGHRSTDFKTQGCKKCSKKHNSLLHYDRQENNIEISKKDNNIIRQHSSQGIECNSGITSIIVDRVNKNRKGDDRKRLQARVLLDSGSQSNFMMKKFVAYKAGEGLNQIETSNS